MEASYLLISIYFTFIILEKLNYGAAFDITNTIKQSKQMVIHLVT